MEGYHTALMKGRYPVCCLFLELIPLGSGRQHSSGQTRGEIPSRKSGAPTVDPRYPRDASALPRSRRSTAPQVVAGEETTHAARAANLTPPLHSWPMRAPLESAAPAAAEGGLPAVIDRRDRPPLAPAAPATAEAPARPLPAPTGVVVSPPADSPPLLQVPLRLIGVVGRLYVLLESDRGLVLLDQHAAHERVLYEQMLNRLEEASAAPSQRLLLPETLELPARDAQFLRAQLPVLARLGVGLSDFGERTFLLDALPPFVTAGNPGNFVLTLVDELKAAGQGVNTLRLGELTVAKTVCRHAVKANDDLARPELEKLIEDFASLRHALHLSAWPAHPHRNKLSRTGKEIRAGAVSGSRSGSAAI